MPASPGEEARARALTPAVVEANLQDIDYAIFERLPEEGSKLGYHPLFKSAKRLTEELNAAVPPEARLTVGNVSARLRGLLIGGLTVSVSIALSGKVDGWQRTARATQLLEEKQQEEPNNSTGQGTDAPKEPTEKEEN